MNSISSTKCTNNDVVECRQPEIVERTNSMEQTAETLAIAVKELEDRLRLVLRDQSVTAEGENELKASALMSPLGTHLRSINDRLWGSVYRIRDITDRIEV